MGVPSSFTDRRSATVEWDEIAVQLSYFSDKKRNAATITRNCPASNTNCRGGLSISKKAIVTSIHILSLPLKDTISSVKVKRRDMLGGVFVYFSEL